MSLDYLFDQNFAFRIRSRRRSVRLGRRNHFEEFRFVESWRFDRTNFRRSFRDEKTSEGGLLFRRKSRSDRRRPLRRRIVPGAGFGRTRKLNRFVFSRRGFRNFCLFVKHVGHRCHLQKRRNVGQKKIFYLIELDICFPSSGSLIKYPQSNKE